MRLPKMETRRRSPDVNGRGGGEDAFGLQFYYRRTLRLLIRRILLVKDSVPFDSRDEGATSTYTNIGINKFGFACVTCMACLKQPFA